MRLFPALLQLFASFVFVMFYLKQDACLQQNYFILCGCVMCQFSWPTSQHQRTTPVIMGQATSRINSYLFKALFSCCKKVECFFCSLAHVLMHLNHILNLFEEPPVSWWTLLPFLVRFLPKCFLSVWAFTCQSLIFTRRIHSTHFSKPNVFFLLSFSRILCA